MYVGTNPKTGGADAGGGVGAGLRGVPAWPAPRPLRRRLQLQARPAPARDPVECADARAAEGECAGARSRRLLAEVCLAEARLWSESAAGRLGLRQAKPSCGRRRGQIGGGEAREPGRLLTPARFGHESRRGDAGTCTWRRRAARSATGSRTSGAARWRRRSRGGLGQSQSESFRVIPSQSESVRVSPSQSVSVRVDSVRIASLRCSPRARGSTDGAGASAPGQRLGVTAGVLRWASRMPPPRRPCTRSSAAAATRRFLASCPRLVLKRLILSAPFPRIARLYPTEYRVTRARACVCVRELRVGWGWGAAWRVSVPSTPTAPCRSTAAGCSSLCGASGSPTSPPPPPRCSPGSTPSGPPPLPRTSRAAVWRRPASESRERLLRPGGQAQLAHPCVLPSSSLPPAAIFLFALSLPRFFALSLVYSPASSRPPSHRPTAHVALACRERGAGPGPGLPDGGPARGGERGLGGV